RFAIRAPANDVVQRGGPLPAPHLYAFVVDVFQAQPVASDHGGITGLKLCFLADFCVVENDAVRAAAVGNVDGVIPELDYRVEAADAGIVQNKIVGVASPDRGDRLGEFKDSVFPVGRGDDKAGHTKWLLLFQNLVYVYDFAFLHAYISVYRLVS